MAYQDLYQKRRILAAALSFDSQPNNVSWIDHQRQRNPVLRLEAQDSGEYTKEERAEAQRIRFQIEQGQLPFSSIIPHRLQPLILQNGLPVDMAASMRVPDDTTTSLAQAIAPRSSISRASTMSDKLRYLLNGDEAISESKLDTRLARHGVRDAAERIGLKIEAMAAGMLLRVRPSMQAAAATKRGIRVPDIRATDGQGRCAYDKTAISL